MGVAVWAILIGVFLGYQGFCLLSDDDRWPPITDIFRDVIRYPAGRWVLFGLWLWLGWHLFVRTLVSPPASSSSIQLLSSATVNGPYAMENSVTIDTTAKTVTVAKSTSTRFYRLSAPSALTITKIISSGGNVVLTYQ